MVAKQIYTEVVIKIIDAHCDCESIESYRETRFELFISKSQLKRYDLTSVDCCTNLSTFIKSAEQMQTSV